MTMKKFTIKFKQQSLKAISKKKLQSTVPKFISNEQSNLRAKRQITSKSMYGKCNHESNC